jgi:hypothetical protein
VKTNWQRVNHLLWAAGIAATAAVTALHAHGAHVPVAVDAAVAAIDALAAGQHIPTPGS